MAPTEKKTPFERLLDLFDLEPETLSELLQLRKPSIAQRTFALRVKADLFHQIECLQVSFELLPCVCREITMLSQVIDSQQKKQELL